MDTFAITIVTHDDGGKKSEAVIGKVASFDFIIGDDAGLSVWIGGKGTIPIAEYFAGSLYLKILLFEFGSLVIVQAVGVLLPGLDQ